MKRSTGIDHTSHLVATPTQEGPSQEGNLFANHQPITMQRSTRPAMGSLTTTTLATLILGITFAVFAFALPKQFDFECEHCP